jgi:hypothetical protein
MERFYAPGTDGGGVVSVSLNVCSVYCFISMLLLYSSIQMLHTMRVVILLRHDSSESIINRIN